MHTLHLVGYDQDELVLVVRGVRAALAELGERVTSAQAAERVGVNALLGEHESRERVLDALAALMGESNGAAIGQIDATPDELAEVEEDPEEDAFATTEPKVWRTAIALMANADGNPLKASAYARTLYGTTNDELFMEVIMVLASSFAHFLPQMLREQGFFESDESHTTDP